MKIPLVCPICPASVLVLEWADHQHIRCEQCGAQFCVVCQDCLSPSVAEYVRRQRSAVLN